MFLKTIQNIEHFIKNIDNGLFFCTGGLFFPFLLLVYRTFSIIENKNFVFEINFYFFAKFPIGGVVLFCYLPSLFFFFFFLFSKKYPLFFVKILRKCNLLFLIYCEMGKVHSYLYDHLIMGTFLYTLYFGCYLYSLYRAHELELVFVISRILIGSYLAFKKFFHKEREKKDSKYIEQFSCMSFYNTFLELDDKLEEKQESTEDQANKKEQKEKKDINPLIGKSWYSGLATLFFVWLYKKNSSVKDNIEIIEKKCDNSLSFLETQNMDLTDLRTEKKEIFSFNLRRPFFFYVSHELFGNILRKCNLFYEKLRALN